MANASSPSPEPLESRGYQPFIAWMIALAIVAATLIVYWPATYSGFVSYDDPDYVTRNSIVRQGLTLQGVSWAFGTLAVANWHPLTWISHMIDCQIFGVDPRGHHFTSVLIHALSAAVLMMFLLQMTGALWRSALVAALFALHPQHVQSVAWVAERKDVLSVLLGLLTLLAYVSYARRRGAWRYALVVALYALALLAKPMMVTLPVLMLLLDLWPTNRAGLRLLGATDFPQMSQMTQTDSNSSDRSRQVASRPHKLRSPGKALWALLIEKLPLFALALASCVITVIAQKRGGTVGTLELIPLGARLANAVVAYAWYVRTTLWPAELAVFYPHPGHWPVWIVVCSAVALVVISIGSIALARKCPALIIGWLWFVVALLPVIGIMQVGSQAYADRYSYLPHIGLFVMIAFGLPPVSNAAGRASLWLVSLAVLIASAIVVRAEIAHWKDSRTLYERAIAVTADNWLAHLNLGNEFLRQNEGSLALQHYDAAVRIRSNLAEAHYGRGQALARLGRMTEATQAWAQAQTIQPDYAAPRYSRALLMLTEGRVDQAMALLDESLELDPRLADAHLLKGIVLADQGRLDEAIEHLELAVQFAPDNNSAISELARARAKRSSR